MNVMVESPWEAERTSGSLRGSELGNSRDRNKAKMIIAL